MGMEWGNAFGVIDHLNTALDFSWLKVLIVVYVIVVGPLLYLLLCKMKKETGTGWGYRHLA